jgi:hypothetical protein
VIGLRKTLILIALFLVLIISSLAVYYINRDSDNDGIPDYKEKEYGTDPNKPNYLLAYALKKLPEKEALKFKNVENFNESSRGFVDLYASLPQDKRNSEEVSELLNQILSDNRIDELEKNLFDDRFVNPTLPKIDNLSWVPVRENLDKIYDINVTFVAKDDKTPISYAELQFIPVEYTYMIEKYGMKPEDYPKVFPPDKERDIILTPVDGKFDSLEEKFSVPIKDIVGGREYRIVVLVRDSAGNEKIVEVKTPYIRQFENIAKTDDITVAALYLLWWGKDNNWANYKGNIFPLLGKYSSKDKIVINKHVDWATGHGIDVFIINWDGPYGYQDDALKNYFLEADVVKRGDIKFGILYETHWRLKDSHPGWNLSDPENVNTLRNDLLYLNQNYFNKSFYFKINSRPFLFIWESKGIFGDLSVITNLRKDYNVYIVSDHAHPEAHPTDIFRDVKWGDAAKKFDAIMDRWGWERYPESDMERWLRFANENGLNFIPGASVGLSYKYAPWSFPNVPEIPRDPYLFEKRLLVAKKYIDPKIKMIFIPEFNNFFEEALVEPDSEYGFGMLLALKEVLEKYNI